MVTQIDKPGSLMHLTSIFQSSDANIVQIDYDRSSINLEFGEAYLTVSLETKGEEHQKIIRENLKHNGYRFKQIWSFYILFIKYLEMRVYNKRHNK